MDGKKNKETGESLIELTSSFSYETHEGLVSYGKLSWYLRAARLWLPVSKQAMLILDYPDGIVSTSFNPNSIYLCRPDAPVGLWNRLPRWRDLMGDEIFTFLNELQASVSEAVLLVFPHPTLEMFGKYLPRYQTDGAFTINIDETWGYIANIVGPWFDVGDVSRWKTLHSAFRFNPCEKPTEEHKYPNNNISSIFEIGETQYQQSRAQRIRELVSELWENDLEAIEKSIPHSVSWYCAKLIPILHKLCTSISQRALNEPLTQGDVIMGNFYNGMAYVFEVYEAERSLGHRFIRTEDSVIELSKAVNLEQGSKSRNLWILSGLWYNISPGIIFSEQIIKEMLLGKVTDTEWAITIERVKKVCGERVIVRSNFLNEDSVTRSAAGIFHSVVNIPLSWIPKASQYILHEHNSSEAYFRDDKLQPWLLIQKYIQGEISWVAFTKDPLWRKGILMEYIEWTNHLLVWWEVVPKYILYDIDNTTDLPAIDGMDVPHLTTIFTRIKEVFWCDVDIEFTISKELLYILQVRPITQVCNEAKKTLVNWNVWFHQIKGVYVSFGNFVGKLKIIRTPKDIETIDTECVIVTYSLFPEFVEKIHLIRWILSESGAVTAHLSIVCRELGIPVVSQLESIISLINSEWMKEVSCVWNQLHFY